ncbi:hypothetical protein BDW22DRAFT_343009 [Trametopsis cervina]|nr:hypothetical protein BDW22DRAFT_343009 [Trametopsis cervina]
MDPPPAKRPRLGPALPDGFLAKPSVDKSGGERAKFISGFNKKGTTNVLRASRPTTRRPDFGVTGPNPAAKRDAGVRPLAPPPNPLAGPSTSKPPDQSNTMKLSALRPVISKTVEGPSGSKASRTHGQTRTMLHNPPVINSPRTNEQLKPVPLPPTVPLPERKGALINPSKLKTLSTTRVAIATDPSSDRGHVELLSIFLQQYGASYVDSVDKELCRGLDQSPEKNKGGKGKGKYVRFVMFYAFLSHRLTLCRGGLAESFSRRFTQSTTDQKLWEEHTSRSFGDGKRRIKPDVRLKITNILYRSPLPENAPHRTHTPLLTLAKGRVLEAQAADFKGVVAEVKILFRYSSQSTASQYQLGENVEVYMWRPWFQLDNLSVNQDTSPDTGLPGDDQPVWLCSRFFVAQAAGGAHA